MTIHEIARKYQLTAGFGSRSYLDQKRQIVTDFHWGVDFATPIGVAIHAHIDCKLVLSGTYGKEVILTMEALDGSCNWTIGHCSEALYKAGTVVKAGTLIGKTGNSGNSTGPHAHIEYDKGRFKGSITANHNAGTTIDPLPIIQAASGGSHMKEEEIAKGLYRVLVGTYPGDEVITQKADFMRKAGSIDQVATDLRELNWMGKDVCQLEKNAATLHLNAQVAELTGAVAIQTRKIQDFESSVKILGDEITALEGTVAGQTEVMSTQRQTIQDKDAAIAKLKAEGLAGMSAGDLLAAGFQKLFGKAGDK